MSTPIVGDRVFHRNADTKLVKHKRTWAGLGVNHCDIGLFGRPDLQLTTSRLFLVRNYLYLHCIQLN